MDSQKVTNNKQLEYLEQQHQDQQAKSQRLAEQEKYNLLINVALSELRQLPEALVIEGREIRGVPISVKRSVIYTSSGREVNPDGGKTAKDYIKKRDELNKEIASLKSKIENMD